MSQAPESIQEALKLSELRALRRARNSRRVVLSLLAVMVLLGAANVFGSQTEQVSAVSGDLELIVTYASVNRLGLASPWQVEVTREGGFTEPITLATTGSYFDIFDENGFSPSRSPRPPTATC